MAARRRTMMNDGNMARRQQQVLDYLNSTYGYEAPQRPSRPLSWHPSTHMSMAGGNTQHQQQHLQLHTPGTQMLSTPNMYGDYQDMYFGAGPQYSPMGDSYSTNTSPCSTFSPLPSSFPPLEALQYFPSSTDDTWVTSQKPNSGSLYPGSTESQAFPELVPSGNSSAPNQTPAADWNSFIMRGFSNTSPPTPETFLQPQQQAAVPIPESSVPYQPLEEPAEEEGEILVGMGLYDTPEKHVEEDPQLNIYRSTVSSLLGSNFRPMEPRGKGLKLEETWEPPKSDDEEDEEEDAEGEEQDEAAGTA